MAALFLTNATGLSQGRAFYLELALEVSTSVVSLVEACQQEGQRQGCPHRHLGPESFRAVAWGCFSGS